MAPPRPAPAQLILSAVDPLPLPLRAELREIHRAALGAGAQSDDWADVRLPEHALRPGFDFLVARAGDALIGFGYGYTGEPGRWWTKRVAAGFDVTLRARWLDPPHYEIVELHVHPSAQRAGIGSRLLAELLARQPHDRALLSTRAESRQARNFYAKHGWTELAAVNFGAGYPPYVVLGRSLPPSTS